MARVLIVDDDDAARGLLSLWLVSAGHEVLEAENAHRALDVMAESDVAVVFCDVHMPGRDGIWLTKTIRDLYPEVPVILATAATLPPRISMQWGVMAHLIKPFDELSAATELAAALEWHDQAVRQGAGSDGRGPELDRWLDSLDSSGDSDTPRGASDRLNPVGGRPKSQFP